MVYHLWSVFEFFFYLNVLQWHSNSFEVNWAEQLQVCDFDVCFFFFFFLDVTYVIRKRAACMTTPSVQSEMKVKLTHPKLVYLFILYIRILFGLFIEFFFWADCA